MKFTTIMLATQVALFAIALPAHAEEVPVGQAGKVFNPDKLQLKVGDSVKFNNDDTVTHAVLIKGPAASNLGQISPGEAKSASFDAPGTYDVKCAIHPKMKLTITVQ